MERKGGRVRGMPGARGVRQHKDDARAARCGAWYAKRHFTSIIVNKTACIFHFFSGLERPKLRVFPRFSCVATTFGLYDAPCVSPYVSPSIKEGSIMLRPLSATHVDAAIPVVATPVTPLGLFFRAVDQWRRHYEQTLQAEALTTFDDTSLADIGYARDAFGLRRAAR